MGVLLPPVFGKVSVWSEGQFNSFIQMFDETICSLILARETDKLLESNLWETILSTSGAKTRNKWYWGEGGDPKINGIEGEGTSK